MRERFVERSLVWDRRRIKTWISRYTAMVKNKVFTQHIKAVRASMGENSTINSSSTIDSSSTTASVVGTDSRGAQVSIGDGGGSDDEEEEDDDEGAGAPTAPSPPKRGFN